MNEIIHRRLLTIYGEFPEFAHQALKIYIISFRIIKDPAIAVCL